MPEASAQGATNQGQFEAQETVADLSRMNGEEAAPAGIVANAYRWLHEICGIASTIGFESTGRSARSCDTLLVGPYRAQRGLSAAELAQLTELLDSLRLAARVEMQILDSNRG